MSKRSAEPVEDSVLKAGDRPIADAPMDEAGEFEDEFEDEFESEDEILEAGVDGRPDAEREEEEKGAYSLVGHSVNRSVLIDFFSIYRSYGS